LTTDISEQAVQHGTVIKQIIHWSYLFSYASHLLTLAVYF